MADFFNFLPPYFGSMIPGFQMPRMTPDRFPLYTEPPAPEAFTPPRNDLPGMYGFDWGEGLPADVVRRSMPKSSAPSFEERTRVSPPWSGYPSEYPAKPGAIPGPLGLAAPRVAPSLPSPQGPEPMPTEQFGMIPKRPAEAPSTGTTWHWQQNNPGNIRMTEGSLKAYAGALPGKNGFLAFSTPEQGINAIGQTYRHIAQTTGADTLRKIVAVYAPKGDGNNDPSAYATRLGQLSGIDPDAKINVSDPAVMARLIPAITKIETGVGQPTSTTTSAAPTAPYATPALRTSQVAEQAPQRPGFDWGPDANIWQIAMQAGAGLSKPTLYGTRGALSQGLEGAVQASQAGQDRLLKRELLKAQVSDVQAKADQRKLAAKLASNPDIPSTVRGFFALGLHEKGMEEWAKRDPEGWQAEAHKLGLIEGTKKSAELAATREATEAGMGKTFAKSAETVLGKIAEARKVAKDSWFATGAPAFATSWLPFTSAGELKQTVDTIRSNIGFDRLAQMRVDSPTGGALGQVAVQELRALQDSIANLETATKKDVFLSRLADVERHYKAIMDKYGSRLYAGGQPVGATTSVPRLNRDGSWQ